MSSFHRLMTSLLLGAALAVAGWQGGHLTAAALRPAALLSLTDARPGSRSSSGLTILFLFRPNECPRLMSVLDLLNRIRPDQARIVGGLTVDQYRFPAWRELVRAEEIHFPVVRLNPLRVRLALTALGYTGGPLLLALDRTGRVVLATDAFDRQELPLLLDQLVRSYPDTTASPRLANR